MKHIILTSTLVILSLLTGCAGSREPNNRDHAELVEHPSGKIEVVITKWQWEGFWGSEGYIGSRPNHYSAILSGNGPVFNNPSFIDNPPTIRCVGTITLDREHKKVIVNMRRITSKPGESERTKPHPANGTYPIESTRNAKAGEPSL